MRNAKVLTKTTQFLTHSSYWYMRQGDTTIFNLCRHDLWDKACFLLFPELIGMLRMEHSLICIHLLTGIVVVTAVAQNVP